MGPPLYSVCNFLNSLFACSRGKGGPRTYWRVLRLQLSATHRSVRLLVLEGAFPHERHVSISAAKLSCRLGTQAKSCSVVALAWAGKSFLHVARTHFHLQGMFSPQDSSVRILLQVHDSLELHNRSCAET